MQIRRIAAIFVTGYLILRFDNHDYFVCNRLIIINRVCPEQALLLSLSSSSDPNANGCPMARSHVGDARSTFRSLVFPFVFFWLSLSGRPAEANEATVSVEPGRKECFFQSVKTGQFIDVDYQVIDGGHGEPDINFILTSSRGHLLISEHKESSGSHRHEATETGDYQVCFDNSFSHISTKVVYFEFAVDDDDEDDDLWEDAAVDTSSPSYAYEMKIEDMDEAVKRVRDQMSKVRHMQEQRKAHEARDRNVQEHNFSRVNWWSVTQIMLMILVGLIQVVMLRSLFDDKSRVHRIWKMRS